MVKNHVPGNNDMSRMILTGLRPWSPSDLAERVTHVPRQASCLQTLMVNRTIVHIEEMRPPK